MTPTEFLQAVWPEHGFYCIATPFVPPNQTKPVWAHKVFQDIDEAVAFVEKQKESKDIFFCIHSLKEEKVWNDKKPNLKTGEIGAYEIRTQANTLQARAFFFDLDVDAKDDTGKKYASQAEALLELREFCKATNFPKPLITSSGGGLHVYWLVEDPIDSADWRQHAHKLRLLANHYKLRVDPSRTTDTASVLRVAGTYNHKRGEKRPVQVLSATKRLDTGRFLHLIETAVDAAGITNSKLVTNTVDDSWNNLSKPQFDGPPVRFKAVINTCGIMADLMAKRGNFSEPEWYASLGVVQYCENGEKLIHNWSAGHPDYSPDATEAKAAQWKNRSSGPASCLKLQEACGADACQTCPFYGKNANNPKWGPLFFARKNDIAEAPVVVEVVADQTIETIIPPPPRPYERLHSGEIVMSIKNKEGDEVKIPILPYDLYPLSRLVNEQSSTEQQTWRVHLPRSKPKDFVLDSDALYDRRKFLLTIANQGIYPSSKNVEHLKDYMIAYISKLQAEADAEAQCNQLGWNKELSQFVLADKILSTDGTIRPAKLSAQASRVSETLVKKGTLERQIELLKFYDRPGYEGAQLMILASLAAPLFHATGQYGAVVNASGDTGMSKSTSIYTAASLWGDPETYTLNGTDGGVTTRFRNERMTTLSNLPVCLDEITHMTPHDASSLVMNITQPGGRGRLTRDGVEKAMPSGKKATLLLSSANSSLHNLLSTNNVAGTAGSMRVVEIYFKANGAHSKEEADKFLREIKENYGHIGEVFMLDVIKNRESVDKEVIKTMAAIDKQAKISGGERFYSAVFAVCAVACDVANRLGLLSYDRDHLLNWCLKKLLPNMRNTVTESYDNPLSILADYLELINADLLVAHKPHAGGNIPSIVQKPRGQMLGHYEMDDKRLWLLRKGFRDYCSKIGANPFKVIEELSVPTTDSAGNTRRIITQKDIKKVLGAGTDLAKAQSRCICIDMSHPEVSGLADLNVVASNPTPVLSAPKAKLKPL
jgi:hypothetical protein